MNGYNGWTNRETWVINLHLGDFANDLFCFDKQTHPGALAEAIESYVYDLLDEQGVCGLFADLIDLGPVNWVELAETYISDCEGE